MKNDKIVIQEVTESRSGAGGVTESWSEFATVWADVEQISGNENYTSDMLVYNDLKRFKIYYNHGQDVTAKMRIIYRGDKYWINSISNVDRLETVITATRQDDE